MAKKRKASSRPNGQSGPREVRDADAKVKPIQSFEDVADSEDEFHMNRDKILLGESVDQKRLRRWKEEDDLLEPSDEEVLGYSSPSEDEGEDEDEDEDPDSADADNRPPPPKRIRRSPNSDAESHGAKEDDFEGWGSSKRDYYNADMIETEQDAIEEETEARRLQQKRLQGMTEADFGLDENDWLGSEKNEGLGSRDGEEGEDGEGGVVTEILPQVEITEDMGVEERLRILRSRYPEFEPLGKEFINLQSQHQSLTLSFGAAGAMTKRKPTTTNGQAGRDILSTVPSTTAIKFQALTAYLGALSMYFALLTSTTSTGQGKPITMPVGELREHAVMESLVKCRGLWERVKDVSVPNPTEPAKAKENELAVIEESEEPSPTADRDGPVARSEANAEKKKKKKKSKAQRALEAARAETDARRAERIRKTEEELAELDILTQAIPRKSVSKTNEGPTHAPFDDSDFGEEAYLDADQAAEKAKRKKSLRFYTSQITQKSNKRGQAGNDAGGDADLPYRERLKDRQARLNAEAEKRGQRTGKKDNGDDLGADSDDNDRQVAKELRNVDAEYYNLIATSALARKSAKKALHNAQAAAAKESRVVHTEKTVGPDGKRAIGYTIEKNKGLAPKRKKDVRNPRVKKRKKYEDKVKKLGSMRQVFKGGEGRGGYKGELTGIKTGLVRSLKL